MFSISILSSPPDPLLPSRFRLFDSAPSQPISFVHTHQLAPNLIHQSAFRIPITIIVHGQPPIHFSQRSRIAGCGYRSLGSVVGSCGWELSLRYSDEIGMFGIGLSWIRRWDCSLGSVPQIGCWDCPWEVWSGSICLGSVVRFCLGSCKGIASWNRSPGSVDGVSSWDPSRRSVLGIGRLDRSLGSVAGIARWDRSAAVTVWIGRWDRSLGSLDGIGRRRRLFGSVAGIVCWDWVMGSVCLRFVVGIGPSMALMARICCWHWSLGFVDCTCHRLGFV